MSIWICFSVFLLASTIFTYVNSQNAIRKYVIRKDWFNLFKAGEFSIYDTSQKGLIYRIESNVGIFLDSKLIAYPSKKEVGRLQVKRNLKPYSRVLSILDPQTNQWIVGYMQRNTQAIEFHGTSFNIDWNGHYITMKKETTSLTSKFHDTNGQLLAEFKIRLTSLLFGRKKYDMEIFSDKYPEQIYLLALIASDNVVSTEG
ncbi:unnamed protein product [Rotaria sp. Silwood1]|nr:unnamed protein product [Rotaria sp. Silwood1]CAF3710997.1 unnamed protein product [Rotaria sp. Silwood1]CAF4832152.1 unnamed protein product [Rotaria sp. Silwood1]